jgi:transcriptional regulator with XRE-family HTH domain
MAYRPGKCQLHRILRLKKLTLTDLSNLTGIRLSQLSDYANNHRGSMNYATALTIAIALSIPMEDLYEVIEY